MVGKDPGNGQPEEWAEDIDESEVAEVRRLLGIDRGDEEESE